MLYRGTMPARLLGRSLTAALVAAILLLYVAGANIWMIAAGVALYGIANGMVTILRGIAVAHYLGVAGFGRKSGMISRSEEHTSELQSLMRISYAVFCLKKKTISDSAYKK